MPDFLPRADAALLAWSLSFRDQINADPESIGLTEQQAADYDAAHAAMADLLQRASDNATRTPSVIIQKNETVASLRALARQLARIIRANPNVDSSQRVGLGLNRGDASAARLHTPIVAPSVVIEWSIGLRVKLRLLNEAEPSRRGIPRGTIGASILACISEELPSADAFWQPQGLTSTFLTTIEFPDTVRPGAKVWFVAQWLNPRLQPGPMSSPVAARVQGGVAVMKGLKVAA